MDLTGLGLVGEDLDPQLPVEVELQIVAPLDVGAEIHRPAEEVRRRILGILGPLAVVSADDHDRAAGAVTVVDGQLREVSRIDVLQVQIAAVDADAVGRRRSLAACRRGDVQDHISGEAHGEIPLRLDHDRVFLRGRDLRARQRQNAGFGVPQQRTLPEDAIEGARLIGGVGHAGLRLDAGDLNSRLIARVRPRSLQRRQHEEAEHCDAEDDDDLPQVDSHGHSDTPFLREEIPPPRALLRRPQARADPPLVPVKPQTTIVRAIGRPRRTLEPA